MWPLALLVAALVTVHPISAHALKQISFSWQANPPEEYVLGYRLYYGKSSRFTSDGVPKANFSYEYYIDLFQSERCTATGSWCEPLDTTELQCDGQQSETPRCTLFNLQDQRLFFALTAYSAETESGYTQELSTPFRPGVLNAIQIVNMLLLNNKKKLR
jgi:hypothetical protein